MKNADELAYPTPHVWAERWEMLENIKPSEGGLTKREYFAGLAMQGIISDGWDKAFRGEAAKLSVSYADALLTELERTK
ncbi:hypothetical protein V8017_16260 [Stenotrophomonas rhizophila]